MVAVRMVSSFPFEQPDEGEPQKPIPQFAIAKEQPLIFQDVPELVDPKAFVRELLKNFHGLGIYLIEDNVNRDGNR